MFAPVWLLLVSQTPEREGPGEYLFCKLDSVANSEECCGFAFINLVIRRVPRVCKSFWVNCLGEGLDFS